MSAAPTPTVGLFAVDREGSKTPFTGTGIRIVVAPGVWIAIDFEFNRQSPVSIVVAERCRKRAATGSPRLAVRPFAGNVVSVAAESDRQFTERTREIVAVNEADIEGDIGECLRKTSSGDPLGEVTLERADRVRLFAETFVIEYQGITTIEAAIEPMSSALLNVRVSYQDNYLDPLSRGMGMLIRPHAANVVAFHFYEGTRRSHLARRRAGR